ncbi:DUF4173 domain-containing protein [Xanthovirga aplysinae]|uniref:DUF4153 domain-containing protein n=1 Tax=Xanthovirga aplysinae TaxID=2529853 RepID=UPI0012BCB0C2|nr:DUF4173 domain-containing protein [Xanthovirga aplysinae]MTI33139.1 DUF4173 domain-containing protein [Xanthovirga aplysinae]
MKRNHLPLVGLTFAYTTLFYKQASGINYLIFNLLLLFYLYWKNKTNLLSLKGLITTLGCLISSASILLWSTSLAIWGNIISLLAVMGFIIHSRISLYTAVTNSIYQATTSFIWRCINKLGLNPTASKKRTRKKSPKLILLKSLTFLIPTLLVFVFLSLYRAGNPAFNDLVETINLDFISINWLLFTIMGYLLLFGLLQQNSIVSWLEKDLKLPNQLQRERNFKTRSFHPLSLKFELLTGFILLALLNLLLFSFNALDLYNLTNSAWSKETNYSANVHQGVNTLIISIVLAIAIIIYFFRKNLNFYRDNSKLKLLAYTWIVQNILLALTTAWKNLSYIHELGLTYKRIGVFIYLILVAGGLITTLIKVHKAKSTWYLFRSNSWIAYLLWISCSLFPWDVMITQYNLKHSQKTDIRYLLSLSETNIHLLDNHFQKNKDLDFMYRLKNEKRKIKFLKGEENRSLFSWNYIHWRIKTHLNQID